MIQVNVNDQELFELIMAVYALEKTSAAPSVGESEDPKFLEVAQVRRGLLEKLHGLFDQNTMGAHDQQVGTPRCAATRSICFGARPKSDGKPLRRSRADQA
jgi:hypothetical protein